MKKVFQIKLKNITRVFALVMAVSLVTFTGCKSYDEDITDLQGQIDAVVTDVAALKGAAVGDYIKSISLGTDGKLTINPSTGPSIVYDAKNYVVYDVSLVNNVLMVNGANKGTVAPPTLTVAGGFLVVNGTATTVAIPAAAGKAVKDVKLVGAKITVSYTDGSADTTIDFVNAFSVIDGKLAVNGVKTNVAIPAAGAGTLIINKDGAGKVVSVVVTDANGSTHTIKVNPSELLSSLVFVPAWIDDGLAAVEVGYIMDKSTVPGRYFNTQKIVYRLNPTTADLSKTTWSFLNNSAKLSAPGPNATNDQYSLFEVPTFTKNADGSGTFTLKVGTWATPATGQTHLFALQANGEDFYSGTPTKVVSDYAKVFTREYNAFVSKKGTTYFHYITARPAKADFPATGVDYQLVADNSNVLDLDDLVLATANSSLPLPAVAENTFESFGFVDYKWEFDAVTSFPAILDNTDQNSFITKDADNKLTVKSGSSSIGRTPLVKATLLTNGGKVLAVGYIKFQIVEKVATPSLTPYSVPAKTFEYKELFADAVAGVTPGDYKEVILTWPEMNNQVYDKMGLTHNQFQNLYGAATPTVTYSFAPGLGSSAPAVGTLANPVATTTVAFPLITSQHNPDVDTYAMKIQINPMAKFGTYVVNYKYATADPLDPQAVITFTYTVKKPDLEKKILAGYQYNSSATEILTQGMNAGANYLMQLYLGEAFSFGTSTYRNVFGSGVVGKVDDATHTFAFKTPPAQVGAQLTPAVGGTIDQALGLSSAPTTGQLMDLTTKLTTAERIYDMQFITNYPNGEKDVFDFKVHFVNPFAIELASPADFQLTDKVNGTADTQDVMNNYIVKFKGKKIVTKGVPEIANTATTVVATDFVDIALPAFGLFYELTPGTSYFTVSKAGGNPYNKQSLITWDNSGTQLTSEQTVATLKVKFVSSFAEITRSADNITVKPE